MPTIIDISSYDPEQNPESQLGLLANREYAPLQESDKPASYIDPGIVALEAQKRCQAIADEFDSHIGIRYVEGIPDMLETSTVYDAGVLTAALDITHVEFSWTGRVQTCELWFETPGEAQYAVSFPPAWYWVDRIADTPDPSTRYRIIVRRENKAIVASLLYEIPSA